MEGFFFSRTLLPAVCLPLRHIVFSRKRSLRAPLAKTVLENARMWLLPDGRVVVVLISHGGVTRDKILRPHRLFSQPELDSIAEFLNQHYAGWTLEAIRGDLLQKLATERERYEGIVQGALTLD